MASPEGQASATATTASPMRPRWRVIRILWMAFRILMSYAIYWAASFALPARTRVGWKTRIHQKNAVRFKQAALSFKGLCIKVGQFMSARVDLLPAAYTDTLAQLQDQVPPAPFSEIRARLIEELGAAPEAVFAHFDPTPIASASLGQVHPATLRDDSGLRVAVKVQYPQIDQVVECDLAALRWIVWVLAALFPHIRFDILYAEFVKIVRQELNYIVEGHHAETFHKNFSDDDRVVVPRVIWKHTTQRVLTLEFVDGIKIDRIDEIRKRGIAPNAVALLVAECYMQQILRHRFFHGDPHPGNLFIQPGPKLVFVDFGLMQEIRPETYRGVQKMILSIIDRDVPGIARALMDLGFIARAGRIEEIERMVSFFMERYRDAQPTSFQRITIRQIAQDLAVILKTAPTLQIPNHFVLVGRTAGMLNGLCARLDPTFNIIELAAPYAKKMARQDRASFVSSTREWLSTLIALPAALRGFLDIANAGRLKTEMSSEDVTGVLTRIYRLLICIGLMAAAGLALLAVWILG